MAIYFVQMGKDGPIKIGYATNVETRIRSLRTGSPYPLTLLLAEEGATMMERVLHQQFAASRLNGEWFSPSAELLDYIAGRAPRVVLPAPLPPTPAPAKRLKPISQSRDYDPYNPPIDAYMGDMVDLHLTWRLHAEDPENWRARLNAMKASPEWPSIEREEAEEMRRREVLVLKVFGNGDIPPLPEYAPVAAEAKRRGRAAFRKTPPAQQEHQLP